MRFLGFLEFLLQGQQIAPGEALLAGLAEQEGRMERDHGRNPRAVGRGVDEQTATQPGYAFFDAEQATPRKTMIFGFSSSIWRSRKGWQAAISAWVGERLPGGRQ